MQRRNLIRHLMSNGCVLAREGAKHSVFFNPENHRISTVPRHNDIDEFLAKKICRDLGIIKISGK